MLIDFPSNRISMLVTDTTTTLFNKLHEEYPEVIIWLKIWGFVFIDEKETNMFLKYLCAGK